MSLPKVAVLASGSGSNFEALVRGLRESARIHLFCDKPGAGVIARAKQLEVECSLVEKTHFKSREDFDFHLAQLISKTNPQLVVLAGFMHRLSGCYFKKLSEHNSALLTLNLHPAHREDYRGAHALKYATQRLFPRWGLTVHVAIEELDAGPILASEEFSVAPWETSELLHQRLQPYEHKLLLSAVQNQLRSFRC